MSIVVKACARLAILFQWVGKRRMVQHYVIGSLNNTPQGANGVMVIVVGNAHGDTSSNPRRDWLHFKLH